MQQGNDKSFFYWSKIQHKKGFGDNKFYVGFIIPTELTSTERMKTVVRVKEYQTGSIICKNSLKLYHQDPRGRLPPSLHGHCHTG